jgi:hypothetical protein
MTLSLAQLTPVSRASLRMTSGGAVDTRIADASPEMSAGPQCPCCGDTMRPLPEREPMLVRCENSDCAWFMAPFRSNVAAVRPQQQEARVEVI